MSALKKRKIAVLGSRSVGKSSLVQQFIENQFVDAYYPTIESTYNKSVVYDGVEYDCQIIDTAGQDEYSPINSQYAIGIHGYVFVYSIASRNSFDMISIVHEKLVDFSGLADIPCVVVGSKCDLDLSSRLVGIMEGEKLANDLHAAFTEASAKENINVGRAFQLCLAEIERRSAPGGHPPPRKPCIFM